jgi:hypothetical protein
MAVRIWFGSKDLVWVEKYLKDTFLCPRQNTELWENDGVEGPTIEFDLYNYRQFVQLPTNVF